MPDRFQDANLAPSGHASSASGPAGSPDAGHSPAPNLMFVPDAAPAQQDRGSRSVWRFGRYIAVYSLIALALPAMGTSALAILAG